MTEWRRSAPRDEEPEDSGQAGVGPSPGGSRDAWWREPGGGQGSPRSRSQRREALRPCGSEPPRARREDRPLQSRTDESDKSRT